MITYEFGAMHLQSEYKAINFRRALTENVKCPEIPDSYPSLTVYNAAKLLRLPKWMRVAKEEKS